MLEMGSWNGRASKGKKLSKKPQENPSTTTSTQAIKKVQNKIKIDKENFQGYGTAKKNREKTVERGKSKTNYKILFWNVAGVNHKDKEFWEYLNGFDIIVLSETWIEEKEWKNLKSKLPKEYN